MSDARSLGATARRCSAARLDPVAAPRRRSLVAAQSAGDPRLWEYLPYGPFADISALFGTPSRAIRRRGPLVLRGRRGRPRGRRRLVPARRRGQRRHRDRPHLVRRRAAAHARGDRDGVPARAPRVRGPGRAAAGVEVRRGQRAVDGRGRALRVHLRGHVPPAHDRQGAQPRHRVVLDRRRRVAGGARRLRGLAGPGNFDADGAQRASLATLAGAAPPPSSGPPRPRSRGRGGARR